MSNLKNIFFISIILLLNACQDNPKPIQQTLSSSNIKSDILNSARLSKDSIDRYATKVSTLLDTFQVHRSLTYERSDYRFEVAAYTNHNGFKILIQENGDRGESGFLTRKIFYQNNRVLLIQTLEKNIDKNGTLYTESRHYFNQNKVSSAIKRNSPNKEGLKSIPFSKYTPETSGLEHITKLKNALEMFNGFSPRFAGLKQVDGKTWLSLNSGHPDSFTGQLLVLEEDEFIQLAKRNSDQFFGELLHLKYHSEKVNGRYQQVYDFAEVNKDGF